MVLDRWLKTWRDRVGAALVTAIVAALALLALMGYGFEPLILLLAALLGHALAYSVSVPLRSRFARRFGARKGVVAFALGCVLGTVLLFVDLYLVGSPSPFSDDGAPLGMLVYGLALGLPSGFWSGLAPQPQPTPEEERQSRRAALQGLLILGGVLTFVLGLALSLFLLFEYVVTPLIRHFAG